jgi:hypothetical protein
MQGCGKKAEEGAEGTEGEEGEVEEASRTAPPAAAPPPAAPPPAAPPPAAPPKPAAPAKGAQTGGFNIKAKPVPEDRFLPIEFDTKEAALVTTGQSYGGKIRRNIFRDIKSSSKLRKDAEMSIEQARKMIDKVKNMPAGSYNATLYKQADENLKQADAAFKDQNYFKAKATAEKAYELASDSIPKAANSTDKPAVELLYKGFYQLSEEKTAMLTKKDPETGAEKLFMVKAGSVIVEDLSNPITIEQPDGSQKKITKLEFKIEQINEDDIVITNITENKPSFNVPISRAGGSSSTGSGGKQPESKAKDAAAKDAKAPVVFQSNQTKSTGGLGSGSSIGGLK